MRTSSLRSAQTLLFGSVLSIVFTSSSCSKLEPTPPSNCQENTEMGSAKRDGDVFIKVINGPAVQEFVFCTTGNKLKTGAGGELWYDCVPGGNPAQVALTNNKIREMANETMNNRVKTSSGPGNRKTLHFTFPTGYDECTLNPATRFNYDAVTGTWSLAGAANGVVWSQDVSSCP